MQRETPTLIEVDLNALRHNYQSIRKRVGEKVRILAVVKSNAYGHGAVPVARALQIEGVDLFGVGTVDEGIQLREAGIKRPILILLGLIGGKFGELLRYELTPVLYDLRTARELNRFLESRGQGMEVQVKIDTGMTRLGVPVAETASFFDELKKLAQLRPVGLISHLADADSEEFTRQQVAGFEKGRVEFLKRFPSVQLHLANSLAALDRRCPYDTVRLGIALYGSYPVIRQQRLNSLKPVMRWRSELVSIKKVVTGTAVSYGRTFKTKRPTLIGVVPVGYADGYPRLASNRGSVLVNGSRVPVVGTVCMDMMMVDLAKVPSAKVGDEVVLLGPQGKDCVTAEELGRWAETISYEIYCRVAERVPRRFVDSERR